MNKSNNKFKAIIGIGNPTKEYEYTYHNVGILATKYLIEKLGYNTKNLKKMARKKFEYIKTEDTIIANSISFMNTSGEAIKNFIKYFDIDPKDILIIQDDSDLYLGSYKIDFDKNSAGHNGIQNIIDEIKTKSFWRLRIGIRKKTEYRQKSSDFVLKTINNKNLEVLDNVFNDAFNNIEI